MATSGSYMKVYSEFRSNDNYNEIFLTTISKLSSELNLHSVKSCLIVGPGDGEHELQFLEQCAANTRKLIAVEPDHKSAERLRTRLTESLPGLDSQVIDTNIESWKGPNYQLDLALLMLVLYYVRANERKELFKKMHDQWLASGGRFVVVSSSRTKCPGNISEIYDRLGTPLLAWEDIEAELLEVGFIKQYAHEMQCVRDFSDIDEYFLRFAQCLIDQPVTLDELHDRIKELFPKGKTYQLYYMFAVFQKAS